MPPDHPAPGGAWPARQALVPLTNSRPAPGAAPAPAPSFCPPSTSDPAAQPGAPPSVGALALLAALRTRVADAEARLAERRDVLVRKRSLLGNAEALTGRLCAESLTDEVGRTPSISSSPLTLAAPPTSRLTRAGDWVVEATVSGAAATLARAALVLLPAGGEAASSPSPWQVESSPPLLSPDRTSATLTATVRGAGEWVGNAPPLDASSPPPLSASACVVVRGGAAPPTHAGRVEVGWDALLALASGALPAEPEGQRAHDSLEEGDAPSTADLTILTRCDAAGLTVALAAVLGPSLSSRAGSAALVPPATVRLAARSPPSLARLVAGVRTALTRAGLDTVAPPLPPSATGSRRAATALATAARAVMVEVDALEAAASASLRLAEAADAAAPSPVSQADLVLAWVTAHAAGAATDAAVAEGLRVD